VPVHDVHDLTVEGAHLERELALIRVESTGERRVEALRMAELMGARVVDVTLDSFVFELAQTSSEIDAFITLMRPLGMTEVTRTGVCAMMRGASPAQ
jgi:acetolactate synthase-1/3 small subunit